MVRALVMSVSDKRAFFAVSLVCVGAAIGAAAVATSLDSLRRFEAALMREQPVTQVSAPVQVSAVLSNDEWFSSLRSEKSWSNRRGAAAAASASKGAKPSAPAQAQPWGLFGGLFEPDTDSDMMVMPAPKAHSGTYRTVCVRTCDGYFFPISFSTTRERFSADEAKCQSSCSSDARLYVYRNPGEEPDNMVDLSGRPYTRSKTAFLYRTAYDASCKCTAHPWEQEARTKHRMYALEAERRKGNKKAVAELKELKAARSQTAHASETGKRHSSKKTSPAMAEAREATPPALESPAASGALKAAADPALTPPPPAPKTRVAEGGRTMQKAMRLGAPPPRPAAKTGSNADWKRRVLSGGM